MFTLTFLPNLNIPGMCFTEYKYAFSQHGLYIPTKTSCVHIPAQETRTSCNVKLPDPGKCYGFTNNKAEDSVRAMPSFSVKLKYIAVMPRDDAAFLN